MELDFDAEYFDRYKFYKMLNKMTFDEYDEEIKKRYEEVK